MKPQFSLTSALALICAGYLAICNLATGQTPTPTDSTKPASPAVATAKSSPDLQALLENIYLTWRQAMNSKDFNTWSATTAASRQMATRNRIISQRLSYPKALFSIPVQAPPLAQLVLLDVLAKGDTANAIYYGKVDFGLASDQTITDNFMVLKFVKELGLWKFDNLRIIKTGNDPDLQNKIRTSDFSFLKTDVFQPSGFAPLVAKSVNPPAYLAELWIAANGFDVRVNVNQGNHKSHITNDDGRDLIIGGLVKGKNTVSLSITPVVTQSTLPKRLEVAIYATPAANQAAKRIFHYVPDINKVPRTYSVTIPIH